MVDRAYKSEKDVNRLKALVDNFADKLISERASKLCSGRQTRDPLLGVNIPAPQAFELFQQILKLNNEDRDIPDTKWHFIAAMKPLLTNETILVPKVHKDKRGSQFVIFEEDIDESFGLYDKDSDDDLVRRGRKMIEEEMLALGDNRFRKGTYKLSRKDFYTFGILQTCRERSSSTESNLLPCDGIQDSGSQPR